MKNPSFYHIKNTSHPELDTLQLAKEFLLGYWKRTQIECPCCRQDVKLRKRKMSSNQAYILYLIYKNAGTDWIHVKEMLREKSSRNNNDWTLLRFWKLLEPKTDGTTKKSLGYWRITSAGVDFLMGRRKASDHILMYNNKIFPLNQEEVTEIFFSDALKKYFNFSEVMEDVSSMSNTYTTKEPLLF